ncbi:MAG: DinB family protein [Candidatus Bathyarchaeota archaeon]|nr:DinB family protein [Candidatus Bathyarchaeota archaeon]
MSKWKDLALWMYGDVQRDVGFWYSHQLREIEGLNEEQLFWTADPKGLCILWHVGHIAHRERTHIGRFLQGLEGAIIPSRFEVFGPDWCSTEDIRRSTESVQSAFEWVRDVREKSHEYIASLSEEDFHKIPAKSAMGLSIGQWLFITTAHTALHIGRIQLLRSLVEGEFERAC